MRNQTLRASLGPFLFLWMAAPALPGGGLEQFTIGNPAPDQAFTIQGQSFTPSELGLAGSGTPTGDAQLNVTLTSFTIAFTDSGTAPDELHIYSFLPDTDQASQGTGSLGTGTHVGGGVYEFEPGLQLPLCTRSFAILPSEQSILNGPNPYTGGSDLFAETIPPAQIIEGGFDIGFSATFTSTGATTASSCSQLDFPQFGNGQGLTSEIVLTNPDPERTAGGEVNLYDAGGDPLDLSDNLTATEGADVSQASPAFSIPPLGSVRIASDGGGELRQGSVAVHSNIAVGGVIRFEIANIGVAGLGSATPLTGAVVPAKRLAGGINTGLAIRNVSSTETATVTVTLRHFSGVPIAPQLILGLQPNQRESRFLSEFFETVNTDDYRGTITVEASHPVAVIALELGQAGQFTTLPATPLP